jgi:hypothetical protein
MSPEDILWKSWHRGLIALIRIFKTKKFHEWSTEIGLSDSDLIEAIHEIEQGLFEANLGANLYKKRVAAQGKGKRGGARTILAFRRKDKAFFVYGYAKSNKSDLSDRELEAYKEAAKTLLKLTPEELDLLLKKMIIREVKTS